MPAEQSKCHCRAHWLGAEEAAWVPDFLFGAGNVGYLPFEMTLTQGMVA